MHAPDQRKRVPHTLIGAYRGRGGSIAALVLFGRPAPISAEVAPAAVAWRHDGLICLVSADPLLTTAQLIAVADSVRLAGSGRKIGRCSGSL